MKRTLFIVYALFCYLLFLATFLYSVGFVGNFIVPKSMDSGPETPLGIALLVDALLLGVFAVQHSVMARRGFKEWWARWVPRPIERSTYVLFACLALILLFWQWRPIGGVVWDVDGGLRTALIALSLAGWLAVVATTYLIDHWELFGLRQVWSWARGERMPEHELSEIGPYKHVRHPLYVGFVVAFWATPKMTVGHLVFAVATLLYILVAIRFEERDLVRRFGAAYRRYRDRVPMLLPLGRRSGEAASDGARGS